MNLNAEEFRSWIETTNGLLTESITYDDGSDGCVYDAELDITEDVTHLDILNELDNMIVDLESAMPRGDSEDFRAGYQEGLFAAAAMMRSFIEVYRSHEEYEEE